jgi:hypothetical protein
MADEHEGEVHYHYEVCRGCGTTWESECDVEICEEPEREEITCLLCVTIKANGLDPDDPRSFVIAQFIIEDAIAEGKSLA